MTSPVERLWEFCCDINQNEINDHIIVNVSGGVATVGIDTEWLDGWHRAVDKLIGDIGDGYMELPKDVDGVPIGVGDMVTEHEDGHTFKVDGIKWWVDGWWVFQDQGIQAPVERCTHYHKSTVEDVLREFSEKMNENMGMYTSEVIDADEWRDYDKQTIAEYADKLREVMDHDRD